MEARYRQVGRPIIQAIQAGALKAGDRLPSVRELCRSHDISLTTALAVYRWLEEENWVEARPKSGYFVRPTAVRVPEPSYTPPPLQAPAFIGVNDTVMRFVHASRRPNVVSLAAAVPGAALYPLGALQRLTTQVIRQVPQVLTGYGMNPAGHPILRQHIARHAATYGLALPPDGIIVTNGAMEALNLALRAVARPGDTVAIESPVYYGLLQMLESQGLKVVEIPTHPQFGLSLEAFELASRPPNRLAALVVIANFNNPTGSLMPPDAKKRLLDLLQERDIPLIEDDIYGDLVTEGSRPAPIKALDQDGRVLLCGTFTKTLAPGLRVGWIAPGRFLPQVELLKLQNSVATPELAQLVVARYMESGGYERFLRSLREKFRSQKARMSDAISRHFPSGTRLSRPKGGFVLWVEMPGGIDSQRLFDEALKQGISIAPGTIFSTRPDVYRSCLRLNAGLPWGEEIEQAVAVLGKISHSLLRE